MLETVLLLLNLAVIKLLLLLNLLTLKSRYILSIIMQHIIFQIFSATFFQAQLIKIRREIGKKNCWKSHSAAKKPR